MARNVGRVTRTSSFPSSFPGAGLPVRGAGGVGAPRIYVILHLWAAGAGPCPHGPLVPARPPAGGPRIRRWRPCVPPCMPEGPEIRRVADRLNEAVGGRVAERVLFGLDRLGRWQAELSGRRVLSVRPRGKALLTRFEEGLVLYSHNQLYGIWKTCAPGRPPRTRRSLRVSIETPHRWARLYSASEIEVLREDELDRHPFLAKLGPDLLDPGTTPVRIRKRLTDPRFRGRALGSLLLDQGFVAGIGNYLRSEILFFSGLRPEVRPADLHEEQVAELARQMRAVIRRSYRTGGVTELSRHVRRARAAGEARRHWRHAVFNRRGRPCRRCGHRVEKLLVASRQLYLCPSCQAP